MVRSAFGVKFYPLALSHTGQAFVVIRKWSRAYLAAFILLSSSSRVEIAINPFQGCGRFSNAITSPYMYSFYLTSECLFQNSSAEPIKAVKSQNSAVPILRPAQRSYATFLI